MATLIEIEAQTKVYADAREKLSVEVGTLTEQMEKLKRTHLSAIKRRVAAAKDARAALANMIEQSPALFEKPRSITIHGVKVGFQKGKGKIEFDDVDQVVKLIKKNFPKQFDTLVKTTHKPIKDALQNLAAGDLKKLGITVEESGDVVLIKDATGEVDKLVSALLKEDNDGGDE